MIKLTYPELARQLGEKEQSIKMYFHRKQLSINNIKDVAEYLIFWKLKNK